MITRTFWLILGYGLLVPSLLVIGIGTLVSFVNRDYDLDIFKMGVVYLVAILGAAMIFGTR